MKTYRQKNKMAAQAAAAAAEQASGVRKPGPDEAKLKVGPDEAKLKVGVLYAVVGKICPEKDF